MLLRLSQENGALVIRFTGSVGNKVHYNLALTCHILRTAMDDQWYTCNDRLKCVLPSAVQVYEKKVTVETASFRARM